MLTLAAQLLCIPQSPFEIVIMSRGLFCCPSRGAGALSDEAKPHLIPPHSQLPAQSLLHPPGLLPTTDSGKPRFLLSQSPLQFPVTAGTAVTWDMALANELRVQIYWSLWELFNYSVHRRSMASPSIPAKDMPWRCGSQSTS